MKTLIDQATTVYVLRHLRPKLLALALGLQVCLSVSLGGALLCEDGLSHLFSGLTGASAALLITCLRRIHNVNRTLRDLEP